MNGLKETEMQHMSFPGPHPLGGVSISGTVGLFNPSDVLSFHLGDVDFGIYLPGAKQDVEIAIVRAIDANLQGNQMSYFNVTGRTLPIQDQQAMSTFLSRYLHGQVSLVNVRGSLQAPDPHYPTSTPDWLKQALQQLTIQVPFPGAEETDLIQDLQLSHIKIDFSPQNTPLISADVSVFLKQPPEFHFDLDVNQIQPTVYLYLNLNSPRPFALVHSPEPCPSLTSKLKNHRLLVKSKLVKAPFRVLPGGQKEFEEFLRRVFYEKRGKVYIRGKSDAQVDSAFGQVQVQDLEFEGVIEIQGMQGLGQPQILDISLVRGYQDALEISTLLDIYNPSNAAVNLGNLNLALLFNHYPIGHVLISSLALDASSHNHVKVSAWLEANNPHVVDFISQYISTGMSVLSNVNLTISGDYPNATTSPWLLPLINALSFNVAVPPFDKEPILADCRVNLWSSTAVMSLRNPFSGMFMTIEKINASATYKQIKVGDMEADFADASEGWKNGPILLPGPLCESDCIGVIVESEKIPVKTKKVGWDAIRKAMGGSIVISVESQEFFR
ncbi:hypothetical protein CU098_001484 [Rhizopus stolonifer]|uniref:Tag1-like fifth Ig-like domain-containing protein n=1 Tax=Rhizopus stolonifer TaxID=4846 RepID=A0A367KCQ3_RHIST|nr:hypothetical protein CU098_001484 [Rhizopus stolonifer]